MIGAQGQVKLGQGGLKVLHSWRHSQKTCTPQPKKIFVSANYKTCRIFWHFDQVRNANWSGDILTQSHVRSSCFFANCLINPDVKVLNFNFKQITISCIGQQKVVEPLHFAMHTWIEIGFNWLVQTCTSVIMKLCLTPPWDPCLIFWWKNGLKCTLWGNIFQLMRGY